MRAADAVSGVKSRRLLRLALLLSIAATLAGAAVTIGAAWWLTGAWPRAAGPPPAGMNCETVSIPSPVGELRGWLFPSERDRGAILLLHGWHGGRRAMVGRARFLVADGYSVLAPDLPAHGESQGNAVTFGLREAPAVDVLLAFLERRFPGRPLAAIGVSLGGASLLMAKREVPLRAVVLESVFPTLRSAVEDRMRRFFGGAGPWIAPLLIAPASWRLGMSVEDVRPIDRIGALECPLLLVHGTTDPATRIDEAEDLFRHAAEPKELWKIPGARHVDLHDFAPEEYERRVLAFLHAYAR